MSVLPELSAEQNDRLTSFQRSLSPGSTTYLNPSDATHKAVILDMLAAAGRTRDKYPALFAAVDSGSAYTGPQADKVHMVDAGKTASGKTTATVWSTSISDTAISGGNLMVFDADNHSLLAQGENISPRKGFVSCPTRGDTAKPAGSALNLLYLGHTTELKGPTRFYAYADNAEVGMGLQADVTAPVISPNNPGNTAVVIAVGRTQNSVPGNADYIYIEQSNQSPPYLICPFTGSIPLSGSPDLSRLTAANLTTNIIIDNVDGSNTFLERATEYTSDQEMVEAFSIGSAPNVLQWDFPYDGKDHGDKGYKDTKSIVYNPGSLATERISYFYFKFDIPLQNGLPNAIFYVCSESSPEEQSINCKKIKNIEFYWHCVAEGTLITMHDGSQVPVERITQNQRVRSNTDGSALTVSATVLGTHKAKASDTGAQGIYTLKTENGKSLTATGCHIIYLHENKPHMISDVAVGDMVITDDGPSAVVSNTPIEHEGVFFGLLLGSDEEKAQADFPHNTASQIAGGILTGDHQSMRHHCEATHHDLDHMLPRLRSELRTDYSSAVNDKRF